MQQSQELNVDFLNEEQNLITLAELELSIQEIDNQKELRINVNDELESALNEIEDLKKQISGKEADNLIEACKTSALNTIVSQFGLASLFIDSKDGGSVTTLHNFDKGITSSEADDLKYQILRFPLGLPIPPNVDNPDYVPVKANNTEEDDLFSM